MSAMVYSADGGGGGGGGGAVGRRWREKQDLRLRHIDSVIL